MVCVVDWIIVLLFVILGLIGVVVQLFNFYWLLKKNDVDFEVLIVGEYKCIMIIFGENMDKGWQKFLEDFEDIYVLFKEYVGEWWLVVDIGVVVNGDIWFGKWVLDV